MKTKRLREIVDYDPETGILRWKKRNGNIVGSRHSQGYRETRIEGHRCYVHRIIWQYVYGSTPKNQIDHINGDRSDNRLCNLREATQQQNSGNMKIRSNNKTGIKGVCKSRKGNKWLAYIHLNYKTRYLGTFNNPERAHAAYLNAASKAFSEFVRSR